MDKKVFERFKLRKVQSYEKENLPKNLSVKIFVGFSVALAVGWFLGVSSSTNLALYIGGGNQDANKISMAIKSTYADLVSNYDGNIDTQKLIDGANKGMVEALGDPYTIYMSSSDAKSFEDQLNGSVGSGIGVELGLRNNRITILRTLADNPAQRVGIQAGDYIVSIDGQNVSGWTVDQVATKIRGTTGTTVKITVERSGKDIDYSLVREVINNLSVVSSIQDNIGILRITRFDEQTGDLARQAVQGFVNSKVKGIVIDLRNNGGGYVSAAQDVAGLWLNDKLILTEKTGSTVVDTVKTGKDAIVNGVKTVVLINGSSASASEILAGAFQDYKIATIVGEKSFGKGSVQKLLSLMNGAELKVTVARWYTPDGKNITSEGIKPDQVVNYTDTDANAGNDTQLNAALEILK